MAARPDLLRPPGFSSIDWRSPLAEDEFAEYRDAAFLERVGLPHLVEALAAFWPSRGPQWDGLGLSGGIVVLAEAKAHAGELASTCAAGPESRRRIAAALAETRDALGAASGADWTAGFYQYANRLAHLRFLRARGVDARLLLIGFLNDAEMRGPSTPDAWAAAYGAADAALGLPPRHALSDAIHHVHPDVTDL
ncbi:MAG: hypothetical protein ACFCUS_12125 [Rubrimonas sp.]|uniref:hypothetical protein n=1 Tax=Rubrimonas sp. TaxID=2036015 RepID=UPI002FDEF07C